MSPPPTPTSYASTDRDPGSAQDPAAAGALGLASAEGLPIPPLRGRAQRLRAR